MLTIILTWVFEPVFIGTARVPVTLQGPDVGREHEEVGVTALLMRSVDLRAQTSRLPLSPILERRPGGRRQTMEASHMKVSTWRALGRSGSQQAMEETSSHWRDVLDGCEVDWPSFLLTAVIWHLTLMRSYIETSHSTCDSLTHFMLPHPGPMLPHPSPILISLKQEQWLVFIGFNVKRQLEWVPLYK